ncbi:MAG: DUF459 domain-containing protein [Acidimicrobiales bacterium]|jgi:hypothetical protein
MNDIPADQTNEPGRRGHAPVATADRVQRGAPDTEEETPPPVVAEAAGPEPEEQPVPGRVHVSWRHALAAGLACFVVWLVLDAPTLLHSAQDAPLGTRRTVAMAVLRPIADISDAFGLGHVVSGANRVIGHSGNTGSGVLQVEGVPAHRHRVAPAPPRAATPPGRAGTTPLPATAAPVPAPAPAVTAPDGLAPLAVPTASAPLRLLVVGDSLGIDFGQPLVNDLAATDVVSAVLDGHIDTGLARPDYFDWQTELQRDIATYQPQAVVVFIGANDPQNIIDGSTSLTYGTAAWNTAYAKRVGDFMQVAVDSGARVLWIGMPPMADPVLNSQMENLNDIDQSQAASHRGVTFFASWPVLGNAQGQYSAFLPNASGSEVQVRDLDGTHITEPGAQRLSEAAIAFMGHEWGLVL